MTSWNFIERAGQVCLTYVQGSTDPKTCGTIQADQAGQVLAWVLEPEQAGPLDVLVIKGRQFVLLPAQCE